MTIGFVIEQKARLSFPEGKFWRVDFFCDRYSVKERIDL